ncbi:MAG: L,D-transpeptidase [Pseudomonadota bacterium]
MGRLCALLLILALSGCVEPAPPAPEPTLPEFYSARQDAGRTLSAVDILSYDPSLRRQRVRLETTEPPGTILIDTSNYHLYLVETEGWAMRYGVGIGREGFGWTDAGRIARRAAWPRWTPPPEMIAREPALAEFENGMPGRPSNPLGARALYVHQGERDTLIRVHGTNAPLSIGTRASSGCFRMLNQDVIDLYARVPDGAKIIVF